MISTLMTTLLLAAAPLATEPLTLILNSENLPGQLPRNFRLEPMLKASGSGQFSENGLKALLEKIPAGHAITVVDLRQESHGFVNGIAVSWYAPRDAANVGRSLAAIEADEAERLQELCKEKNIAIHRIVNKPQDVIEKSETIPVVVEKTATEKNLTESFKIGYFRIPVTDHLPPPEEQLERFLAFIQTLPANSWLHFHCEAGEGRTTTFLTLYDILKNCKRDSFDAIIWRQHQLGGINLSEMPSKESWKYPFAVERLNFLQKFYQSCKAK